MTQREVTNHQLITTAVRSSAPVDLNGGGGARREPRNPIGNGAVGAGRRRPASPPPSLAPAHVGSESGASSPPSPPLWPRPLLPPVDAAGERAGPRGRRRRRRAEEGVPVRGARRGAVRRARGDQARVPAARAQVSPGRQQGGAVPPSSSHPSSRFSDGTSFSTVS